MKNVITVMMMLFVCASLGCRAYQKPIFVDVLPHETAFAVPLEGDTSKQDAFGSAEMLLKKKVAAKRVEIPTRWVKTGRMWTEGDWRPTIIVIRVDRTPVTCIFTSDDKTGTAKKNQALYAESKDSIGVSSGFSLTALIEEENAHTFLYKFKGDSLKEVIDNQVFNSVQSIYTEICNKYDLKALRGNKQEITDRIRQDVIPMYKEWGITINPDMGLVGGFVYEDKEIQQAINAVFVNQTQKEANEAKRDAQEALNEQQMSAQKNQSEMLIVQKEAEAKGILVVAEAMSKAGAIYINNKTIEAFESAIEKWNGTLPTVNGGGIPMMFNMPMPQDAEKK